MPEIRIKPERLEGETQDKIAAALGIDRTLISRFRAGHRIPNNPTMARVLLASGLTFDELFDVIEDAA